MTPTLLTTNSKSQELSFFAIDPCCVLFKGITETERSNPFSVSCTIIKNYLKLHEFSREISVIISSL